MKNKENKENIMDWETISDLIGKTYEDGMTYVRFNNDAKGIIKSLEKAGFYDKDVGEPYISWDQYYYVSNKKLEWLAKQCKALLKIKDGSEK